MIINFLKFFYRFRAVLPFLGNFYQILRIFTTLGPILGISYRFFRLKVTNMPKRGPKKAKCTNPDSKKCQQSIEKVLKKNERGRWVAKIDKNGPK